MRTLRKKSSDISATKEDYVRAIYILGESDEETGVTHIATKLKLSKSTVSERVKELVRDGLATAAPYAQVILTEKGKNAGKKLTYKHRLIEVFLYQVLKMPKDKIHVEAEKLEHAFSDEVIKKLAKFLDYPTNDPHGSAIPKIENWNLNKVNKKK
jgi:DtxR family transcriptional regulator, Mn-dependent transcriptional regulator